MSDREKHIQFLLTAELQFRTASAVRLAVARKQLPLDLPMEWTHGQHRVRFEEIALMPDQADFAAFFIQQSATFMMAVAIKDSIEAITPCLQKTLNTSHKDVDVRIRKVVESVTPKPWKISDHEVVSAYHIARLIRNAYSHAPFAPTWMIPSTLQKKVLTLPGIITLDTNGLHGTLFDWRHYGGPLAMFRFCIFVRTQILGHEPAPRKVIPIPKSVIYQQGDLILTKVNEIPPGAVPKVIARNPDGSIPLGDGHVLHSGGPPDNA